MYKYVWYCRWDGKIYKPLQETDRDGFCSNACKQALYRAHKKYVTLQDRQISGPRGQGVTPSKAKTKGKKHA